MSEEQEPATSAPVRRSRRGRVGSRRHQERRQSVALRSAEELELVFRDLTYTVQLEKKNVVKGGPKEKKLLSDITGIFRPRRLTAIMGSSGAGKTTLLSVLAGNVAGGKVQGTILVNGEEYSGDRLKEISGFVFQDDILLPTMTVREAIAMSAILRLPKTISVTERDIRIDGVLELMHLQKAKDTVIGSPLHKGVSGGERKRTAIGMEMVTNPAMLFLDEPTTGLDTFTAYTVVMSLKRLAQQGRTIVATIHQPSTETFNLFDDILILSRGRIAYFGPVPELIEYFARHGYPCPKYSNPSDYIFMKVLREFGTLADDDAAEEEKVPPISESETTEDETKVPLIEAPKRHVSEGAQDAHLETVRELQAAGTGQVSATAPIAYLEDAPTHRQSRTIQEACDERIESLLQSWDDSSEQATIKEICQVRPHVGVAYSVLKKRGSLWTQFRFLSKRATMNFLRNHVLLAARVFQSVFIGVILGLIYVNTNNYGVSVQIRNKSGALYFYSTNMFFSMSSQVLGTFGTEKVVFYREYNAGYYSIFPYYVSKTLVELPGTIIAPYLVLIICYYMIGLTPAFSSYLFMATLGAFVALCGTAYGIMISALVDDVGVALTIAPLFLLPLVVVSGVFVAALPVYINWLKYVSPIYYAFSGMLETQFNDTLPNCDSTQEDCSPDRAFSELSFESTFSAGVDVVFLATIYAVLWVAGFLALYWGAHKKK